MLKNNPSNRIIYAICLYYLVLFLKVLTNTIAYMAEIIAGEMSRAF